MLVEERAGDLEGEAWLRDSVSRSLSESVSEKGNNESFLLDPNLSDLSLDRMQPR